MLVCNIIWHPYTIYIYITYTITHYWLFIRWHSLPLTAKKALTQMPYQWLYNPLIKMTAIGFTIQTLQNIIKMLKQSQSTSITIVTEQLATGLGTFLESWKCNILVTTQALMPCLIYTHSTLGVMHIYQVKHSCPHYNLYIKTTLRSCY